MQTFPTTLILRHRKENLKKCTLRGLENRSDCCFFTYPKEPLPSLDGYCLLTLGAPPLTGADAHLGIFLIDGTWRYAEVMYEQNKDALKGCVLRTLPSHVRTAYPRRQEDCSDPSRGLASVEAIYIAYYLMERDTSGLLDFYYWKDKFLEKLAGL